MDFLYELYHHGIKGQKWGVRRYRNEDGSLTVAGKQRERLRRNVKRNRPYTDDINDIVKTLSKKERDFLGAEDNEEWIDKNHENEMLSNKAVSFVSKYKNTPISFIEVWSNGGSTGQIALATRNDPKYRGKGLASKNVESVTKWMDRYGKKSIKELEWIADKNNTASINLAKKHGFVEDTEPHDHSDKYVYLYRR